MKEKKLPIFFFSIIFACIVWVSVNLGNDFQTSIDVPVTIENIPPAKAVATILPEKVRLKIQGTGWQLLNAMISPNIRYTLDFGKLSFYDTLFTHKNLSERISLPHTIRIFETFPETVVVRLDTRITKTVPIQPVVNVSYRTGFDIVGKMSVIPETITISGARSLLNSITTWRTAPVSLKDVNAPTQINVELLDTLQLEIDKPQMVATVKFDVQPIAEKTINDIPIDVVQAPINKNILLIPPKVSIIIRSGVNAISSLSTQDFHASIDYTSILLDTSGFIQPSITGPTNVRIVQLEPEKIQYVLRK